MLECKEFLNDKLLEQSAWRGEEKDGTQDTEKEKGVGYSSELSNSRMKQYLEWGRIRDRSALF